MPPDSVARTWIAHARGDLALAEAPPPPGVPLELLCFHAQQAAEKALKAVLLSLDVVPPRTHDIGALLELVEARLLVPPALRAAAALSDYAVVMRYPGEHEPVVRADLHEALQQSRSVVEMAALFLDVPSV